MRNKDELDELLAADEGSGTREDWRALALRLRYELDINDNQWIRFCWIILGVGFAVGMTVMWLIMNFGLYCSFNIPLSWFAPHLRVC